MNPENQQDWIPGSGRNDRPGNDKREGGRMNAEKYSFISFPIRLRKKGIQAKNLDFLFRPERPARE